MLCLQNNNIYIHTLVRTWLHNQIKHPLTYVATTTMAFAHTKVNYYMHNYIGGYYTHDISTHTNKVNYILHA